MCFSSLSRILSTIPTIKSSRSPKKVHGRQEEEYKWPACVDEPFAKKGAVIQSPSSPFLCEDRDQKERDIESDYINLVYMRW